MLISPLIDPFAIRNIVEDTSPQLGGHLDVDGKIIFDDSQIQLRGGLKTVVVETDGNDARIKNITGNNLILQAYSGSIIAGSNLVIGRGEAGIDYTLTFDGESDDCIITYDEDNNLLNFGDTAIKTTGTAEIGTNAGNFQCIVHGYLQLTNIGSSYGGGLYFYAGEGQSADFFFYSNEGNNNADKWRLSSVASTNDFKILNKVSGSFVDKLKITTAGAVYLSGVYDDSHGGTGRAMYIQSTGQLTCDTSARRFKENIKDLSDTSWIYDLTPREADWKNSNVKADPVLIAEEVELVNPKLVSYAPEYRYESRKAVGPDGEDETKDELIEITETNIPDGVHYYKLIVPMLKEIQKLRQEIDILGVNLDGPR